MITSQRNGQCIKSCVTKLNDVGMWRIWVKQSSGENSVTTKFKILDRFRIFVCASIFNFGINICFWSVYDILRAVFVEWDINVYQCYIYFELWYQHRYLEFLLLLRLLLSTFLQSLEVFGIFPRSGRSSFLVPCHCPSVNDIVIILPVGKNIVTVGVMMEHPLPDSVLYYQKQKFTLNTGALTKFWRRPQAT